jgi:uncharacterized cupredoxin-like copper-binding protein
MRDLKLLWKIALAVLLVTLAGCPRRGQVAAPRRVSIIARDYSFEMPQRIEAGLIAMDIVNRGQEPHHAQLMRLKPGVAPDQFRQALQKGPEAILALVDLVGGPSTVDPGGETSVTLNLGAGMYFALCFIPSRDGLPHFAKGMVSQFEASGSKAVSEPSSQAQVVMKSFAYQVPAGLKGGAMVKVINQGDQPHEMAVVRLAPGQTMQDYLNWLKSPKGPPPGQDVGGLQAVAPGGSGWLELPKEMGSYLLICNVPDPASGKPHWALGMISQVDLGK